MESAAKTRVPVAARNAERERASATKRDDHINSARDLFGQSATSEVVERHHAYMTGRVFEAVLLGVLTSADYEAATVAIQNAAAQAKRNIEGRLSIIRAGLAA